MTGLPGHRAPAYLCDRGEIYAGDNQVYNAGSGNAIRSASPNSKTNIYRCIYGLRAPQ